MRPLLSMCSEPVRSRTCRAHPPRPAVSDRLLRSPPEQEREFSVAALSRAVAQMQSAFTQQLQMLMSRMSRLELEEAATRDTQQQSGRAFDFYNTDAAAPQPSTTICPARRNAVDEYQSRALDDEKFDAAQPRSMFPRVSPNVYQWEQDVNARAPPHLVNARHLAGVFSTIILAAPRQFAPIPTPQYIPQNSPPIVQFAAPPQAVLTVPAPTPQNAPILVSVPPVFPAPISSLTAQPQSSAVSAAKIAWDAADRETLLKASSRQRYTETSGFKIRAFLTEAELLLTLCSRPRDRWGFFVLS